MRAAAMQGDRVETVESAEELDRLVRSYELAFGAAADYVAQQAALAAARAEEERAAKAARLGGGGGKGFWGAGGTDGHYGRGSRQKAGPKKSTQLGNMESSEVAKRRARLGEESQRQQAHKRILLLLRREYRQRRHVMVTGNGNGALGYWVTERELGYWVTGLLGY